jgi:hypothetical protein
MCLTPWFDGVILLTEWKDALWDKFVTEAPRPRTPSEVLPDPWTVSGVI